MNVLRILFLILALIAMKAVFIDNRSGGPLSEKGTLESEGLLPLDVQYLQGPAHAAGKPLLLEFWATWCVPCIPAIAHLNELNRQFRHEGLQIVGLSDESPAVVQQFMTRYPMNYTVALDPAGKYAAALRSRGVPHAHLFNADGKRVWDGHPDSLTPEIIAKAFL